MVLFHSIMFCLTKVQSLVSGLFTSAFALGNFAGPTISGILYGTIGFSYNCLVIQASHSKIQLLHDTSIICVLFQGIVLVVAVCNMAAYVTLTKTRTAEVEEASNQT